MLMATVSLASTKRCFNKNNVGVRCNRSHWSMVLPAWMLGGSSSLVDREEYIVTLNAFLPLVSTIQYYYKNNTYLNYTLSITPINNTRKLILRLN